jgi:hypothetical protein
MVFKEWRSFYKVEKFLKSGEVFKEWRSMELRGTPSDLDD